MARRPRTASPAAREAAALLGAWVRLGRRERRWTVAELAERVGVSVPTIEKVERGDLTVALGTAQVGDVAALTAAERGMLWGRQILNPFALDGIGC